MMHGELPTLGLAENRRFRCGFVCVCVLGS